MATRKLRHQNSDTYFANTVPTADKTLIQVWSRTGIGASRNLYSTAIQKILDNKGMRIIIYSGIDQLVGFDVRPDHCRATILAAWTEVADNGKMNFNRLLLSMALIERHWNNGRFSIQEGYIQYVYSNKASPKLWCHRVTVSQAETVRKICYAIRWRHRLQRQNTQGMSPEELSTFRKNATLVKTLSQRSSLTMVDYSTKRLSTTAP